MNIDSPCLRKLFYRNLGLAPNKEIVNFLENHENVLIEAGQEGESDLKFGD